MIAISVFGCKREQIIACSWEDACERFPCTSITLPDWSAFTSMSAALTCTAAFSPERVPLSIEPFYELGTDLTAAIRRLGAEDMLDAGARWAGLPSWSATDINSMDLAGFLLSLHSFVNGSGKEANCIFLLIESDNWTKS